MKKIVSCILSVMLVLGLLGGIAAAEDQQTIRILWWGSQTRHDLTTEMVNKFMEKYPNIKVEVEFTDWGGYWSKLATQVAGDLVPDVIQMDYAYLAQYAGSGVLEPLDPYIESGALNVDNVSDSVLDSGKIDGTLYALSTGTNVPVLMYRADLVEAAGKTLSMQPTLEEYIEVSKAVYEATGHTDTYITSYGHDTLRFRVRDMGLNLYSDDGKSLGYDASHVVDMWKVVQQADTEEYALPVGETTAGTAFDRYVADTWAGYCHTNELAAYQDGSGVELAMAAIPTVDGATTVSTYLKPTMFWSVSAKSQAKDAAIQFVEFFTNDTDCYDIMGMDRGMPISSEIREYIRPSLDANGLKIADVIDYFSEEGRTTPIMNPDVAAHNEIGSILDQYGEQLRYGLIDDLDATAAQFIEEATALLNK